MDRRQERALVENEARLRDYNERLSSAIATFRESDADPFSLMCECCLESCTSMIDVGPDEYVRVREHPARFVVAPDHVVPEIEQVVDRRHEYWVIEKRDLGGAIARDLA